MKKIITTTIISLYLSIGFSNGQKVALLKTDFKSPILYTDSVTVNQIKGGYFPIRISDIDTFHSAIEQLYDLLNVRQRIKMQSFEYRAGNCVIKTERVPMGYGDRYIIKAFNLIDETTTTLNISDGKTQNILVKTRLKRLLNYLEAEQKFTIKPYTITPKYYNIVVISE
jgi:hypothetical protein